MSINHAELGYFEKTPNSGIWWRPGTKNTYEPRSCESCGADFMGERKKGKGRFCSLACIHRKEDVGYGGRHDRVKRVRGSAVDYACAGCGQPAEDWSQVHGTTGNDPEHYVPRCKKCHARYDAEKFRRGEDHHNAKLSEARVRGIWASAGATLSELAELHGVGKSTVYAIRAARRWQHITGGRKAEW